MNITASSININLPAGTTMVINEAGAGDVQVDVPAVLPATSANLPYAATVTATFYEGVAIFKAVVARWDSAEGKSKPFVIAPITEYGYTLTEFNDVKAVLSSYLDTFTFATLRQYADWIDALLRAFADLTKAQYANA